MPSAVEVLCSCGLGWERFDFVYVNSTRGRGSLCPVVLPSRHHSIVCFWHCVNFGFCVYSLGILRRSDARVYTMIDDVVVYRTSPVVGYRRGRLYDNSPRMVSFIFSRLDDDHVKDVKSGPGRPGNLLCPGAPLKAELPRGACVCAW